MDGLRQAQQNVHALKATVAKLEIIQHLNGRFWPNPAGRSVATGAYLACKPAE